MSNDAGKTFTTKNATTGEVYIVDTQGHITVAEAYWSSLSPFDNLELSRRIDPTHAYISFGTDAAHLEPGVRFETGEPASTIVTLRSLGPESNKYVYAYIETAPGGRISSATASVFKVDRTGKVICKIPLATEKTFASTPDPIRIKNGIVYQMVLQRDHLGVKRWDTN